MYIAFILWGSLGLILSLYSLLDIALGRGSTGTSAYVSALALIWIGGMLFFALGAILNLMKGATLKLTNRAENSKPVHRPRRQKSR